MRAVRIHQFGGPDVLRLEDVAKPTPGQGELLIRVLAAGVNPVDYKTREGRFPPVQADKLPLTLGRDVAGVVAALGVGAAGFVIGEAVYAMLPTDRGGYAEWVAASAALCASSPARLDPVQAASVPLAALTAWQGLFTHGRLKAGQRVLIHGGGGGVGPFAVQFAKWAGAEVFTTVSARDRAFVEDLGADRGIDYATERFETLVQNADLVFDLIGGETQDRSWSVLKRGGALVSTVEAPDVAKARERGVIARRFMCEPDGGQLASIARLIDESKVRVTVERVFPLAEAALAETHLERGHVTGKVVLQVAAD